MNCCFTILSVKSIRVSPDSLEGQGGQETQLEEEVSSMEGHECGR